jgi:O-6-methylguanine DNA methyltransferase
MRRLDYFKERNMAQSIQAEKVYYGSFSHRLGLVRIAASAKGVVQVGLPSESDEKFWAWLKTRFSSAEYVENKSKTKDIFAQLKEYFEGKRCEFSVELDLRGTEFQKNIWRAIARIPYGRTISYRELADRVGLPQAVRAAGAATGANPIGIIVPCHRVIGSDGGLTGYGGGLPMKVFLLNLERGANEFTF